MTMEIRRLLSDSLDIAREKHPQKIAAQVGRENYSYEQLYQQSQAIAAYLLSRGLQRGDRVAIFMENSWALLPNLYAVLYAGGVFLVINHLTKSNKLEYILSDSDAKFLLTESSVAKQFLPAVTNLKALREVIYAGNELNKAENCKKPLVQLIKVLDGALHKTQVVKSPVINKDIAALIYTSGSTGDPKGVIMTHANMVFTTDSLIEYLRLDANEKIICFLPLAFDYGLYQILMSVRLGACLIVSKSFAFPSLVFEEIQTNAASVFPGVPTVFSTLIGLHQKSPLCFPSIKRVTNTAAALPPEYVPLLKQIFPNALIYKMYGLTECKRVSFLKPEEAELYPNSVGKAIPGTEVFLLDEKLQPVPPNTLGTLYVRGAHVMQGYWNKPEETKKMLIDNIFPNEQILCAQDQFVIDEKGYLYFHGRVDDIIKSRGEKVSPVEVENVLYRMPGIREAAVIGVPDLLEGETIKAFVAIDTSTGIDSKKIRQHCMANLEGFMVPRDIVILESLPKTDSNKISKKELR
ncbi:MAG: long chain acyl-CoA synthetase [Gammaproteobacteria bacterium]|nr:MAG: long chain acyl-CoA synthetase [Gammaproteobacteria bacterium]